MSESGGMERDLKSAQPEAGRRFWTTTMLPLRITRTARSNDQASSAGELKTALDMPPPRLLRLWRALVGIVLLALAWAGILVMASVAQQLADCFPRQHPTLHLVLYLLGVVGACWISTVTLACILTGAFCLMLAFT